MLPVTILIGLLKDLVSFRKNIFLGKIPYLIETFIPVFKLVKEIKTYYRIIWFPKMYLV